MSTHRALSTMMAVTENSLHSNQTASKHRSFSLTAADTKCRPFFNLPQGVSASFTLDIRDAVFGLGIASLSEGERCKNSQRSFTKAKDGRKPNLRILLIGGDYVRDALPKEYTRQARSCTTRYTSRRRTSQTRQSHSTSTTLSWSVGNVMESCTVQKREQDSRSTSADG